MGGLPIFTVWINPTAPIEFSTVLGGRAVLIADDGFHNLDSGLIVKCGDIEIAVSPEDFRKGHIESVEVEGEFPPFGDFIDKLIFKYATGVNYPRPVWTRLPGR